MSYDAIVLASDANGLTAAATLERARRKVLVLEEHDLGPLEFAPGFKAPLFDVPAQGPRSVPTGDGTWLTLWTDPSRAATALDRLCPPDAVKWPRFAARLSRFATFLGTLYREPAPAVEATAPRDVLALVRAALRLRSLGRSDMTEFLRLMPMPIQELLDDEFEFEPLKAAVAGSAVRDLRQGPRSGGTTFNLLHYLAGAVTGGRAVRRSGGEMRTGTRVARILVRDDAVVGVALESGEEIQAPTVLSTLDPKRTLLDLVDPVWLDPEFLHAVKNIKLRGSTTFVLYALDGLPEVQGLPAEALSGTLTLTASTADLERAADAAKYGRASGKPHVEITIPSLRWPPPHLAPAGKHVVVARAQWGELSGETVTGVIEGAVPCFTSQVLHQTVLGPAELERRFGLTEGALTQGELMLDQILFMRPVPGWSRYAMPIRGLYLGGAGTHPGPGIIGGPGWLASKEMLR